jgi:amino acid adenylation domain-containing protein
MSTENAPELAHRSMVDVFRSVAAARCTATAIIDGNRRLSYRELDAASDRVAGRLLADGVRRGDIVAIQLPRSAEIAVAVLAVWKAGAAYLPIDPAQPADRISYLLNDARVRHVITEHFLSRPHDTAMTGPVLTESDSAYVIYTSGSTGPPKGCVVSHGNLLALLRSALPLFAFGVDDRWALFHSYGFDVSVWELWGCLTTGATAVVVSHSAAQSSEQLLQLVSDAQVSVLCQVPSVFRPFVLTYTTGDRPPLYLRYLIFAGESIELDVVRDFLGQVGQPGPVCVNMYGPTETTIYATHRVLTDADLLGPVRSPIGAALPGLRVEIMSDDGAALPAGQVGEVWIAGATVTAGYLHRPELTAQRFVAPATSEAVRYYRTGDLARRLADGTLEYLGRNDEQVKLHGYRIELGEIEAALRSCAEVHDSAVILTGTPGTAQFLVAFVVAPDSHSPAPQLAARLRDHLALLLPNYLVPPRYRFISQLPLTSSGKLDRSQLQRLGVGAIAPARGVRDTAHLGAPVGWPTVTG